MKKISISILIICIVGITGFLGYKYISNELFVEKITPLVKNVSLRTYNIIDIENKSTNITFKEYFAKIDADLIEIGNKKLEIQSYSTETNKEVTDKIAKYFDATENFLRSMRGLYMVRLDISSLKEQSKKIYDNIDYSNEFSRKYIYEREDEIKKEIKEKQEELTKKESELGINAISLITEHSNMGGIVSNNALLLDETLSKIKFYAMSKEDKMEYLLGQLVQSNSTSNATQQ